MKPHLLILCLAATQLCAATLPSSTQTFLENRCYDLSRRHDDTTTKGDFDLTALQFDPADAANFLRSTARKQAKARIDGLVAKRQKSNLLRTRSGPGTTPEMWV